MLIRRRVNAAAAEDAYDVDGFNNTPLSRHVNCLLIVVNILFWTLSHVTRLEISAFFYLFNCFMFISLILISLKYILLLLCEYLIGNWYKKV